MIGLVPMDHIGSILSKCACKYVARVLLDTQGRGHRDATAHLPNHDEQLPGRDGEADPPQRALASSLGLNAAPVEAAIADLNTAWLAARGRLHGDCLGQRQKLLEAR